MRFYEKLIIWELIQIYLFNVYVFDNKHHNPGACFKYIQLVRIILKCANCKGKFKWEGFNLMQILKVPPYC